MRKLLILSALATAAASQAAIVVTYDPGKIVADSMGRFLAYGTVTNTGTVEARLQGVPGVPATDPSITKVVAANVAMEPTASVIYKEGFLHQTLAPGASESGILGYIFNLRAGASFDTATAVQTDWYWVEPSTQQTGVYSNFAFVQSTPEPATWAAMGFGAVAMLRRRRR